MIEQLNPGAYDMAAVRRSKARTLRSLKDSVLLRRLTIDNKYNNDCENQKFTFTNNDNDLAKTFPLLEEGRDASRDIARLKADDGRSLIKADTLSLSC